MKVSDVIKELKEMLEHYGDLEVANDLGFTIDQVTIGVGANNRDYIEVGSYNETDVFEE